MIYAAFTSGIILIACGFLAKMYPNLIAGYNTLSEEEKQRVDISGLSSLMKKRLIALGSFTIIYGVISYVLDINESYSFMILCSVIVIGVIIMLILSQKYNPKS